MRAGPCRVTDMRALIVILCLLAAPALADVAGTASVIDGDTLEVHGQRTVCNKAGHQAWDYVFGGSVNGLDPIH